MPKSDALPAPSIRRVPKFVRLRISLAKTLETLTALAKTNARTEFLSWFILFGLALLALATIRF